MNPKILRFPGGNYIEGVTIDTRWDWKQTVGPIWERPGHENSAWGYWSDDGLGGVFGYQAPANSLTVVRVAR